jgi:hypothetical protein
MVPLTPLGVYLFSVLTLPFALVGVIAFPIFRVGHTASAAAGHVRRRSRAPGIPRRSHPLR